MDGGLRGGGYGSIFIFAVNVLSFLWIKVYVVDSIDKVIVYFNGIVCVKVVMVVVRVIKVSTRSVFRVLSIFVKALAYDL